MIWAMAIYVSFVWHESDRGGALRRFRAQVPFPEAARQPTQPGKKRERERAAMEWNGAVLHVVFWIKLLVFSGNAQGSAVGCRDLVWIGKFHNLWYILLHFGNEKNSLCGNARLIYMVLLYEALLCLWRVEKRRTKKKT